MILVTIERINLDGPIEVIEVLMKLCQLVTGCEFYRFYE